MALESKDQKQIIRAMHDIVETCTFGSVNARQLPVAELEFIFLKLRTKSIGENSHVGVKCQACGEQNEIDLNLEEINLDVKDVADKKIMLTDTVGVMMKYPTADDVMKNVNSNKSEIENTYAVIAASLDKIFDTENVYDVSTQSKEEVNDFIESLNQKQFEKIKEFFEGLPRLKHPVKFTCEKCKHENSFSLEGLENFFA
jgi:DNA-directed RNA polymerase subunit M/transcription elongation factor TFIIS